MLAALDRLGAQRASLRAKLFGGACPRAVYTGEPAVGLRNVTAARAFLARHHIPLVEEDTGQALGRRLVFDTDSGAAEVIPLERSPALEAAALRAG